MRLEDLTSTDIVMNRTFGPGRDSFIEVGQVATLAAELWGDGAHWELDHRKHPHEANLLAFDTSKVQRELGRRNRLGSHDALRWTVDWERRVRTGTDPLTVTREQNEPSGSEN